MPPATMRRTRVLVVEDDHTLNGQISCLLESKGYQTLQCYAGEDGLLAALGQRFDLILLDVMLPQLDGFEVLNRLRKTRQTPVIMLTACGAEEERILGLSCGADDYVPKPFAFTELLLRIEALLRRTRGHIDLRNDPAELRTGSLTLKRGNLAAHYAGKPISLTPTQFRLLWILALHQGETLSKPYLYQIVLERTYSRFDRGLDMHLSRVRRKLTEAGMAADRLQTMHGKGYCFL